MNEINAAPRPLSVGIVGAGRITVGGHLPALQTLADTRLTWISDAHAGRGGQLARAAGIPFVAPGEEPDVDIVLLAIPVPGRETYLDRHRGGSTALFVEKPFANSADEQLRLAQGYPDHLLGVGYQRRYYATSEFARRAIRGGWFGRLREIDHQEGNRVTSAGGSDYQDEPPSRGGGITKNLACHGIDLALHLAGAEKFHVEQARLELDGRTDRSVDAVLNLRTPDGDVRLHSFVTGLRNTDNSMRLRFDHAVVTFSTQPSAALTVGGEGQEPVRVGVQELGHAWLPSQAFHLEWRSFLDGVRDRRTTMSSACTSLITARALDAILEAGGAA